MKTASDNIDTLLIRGVTRQGKAFRPGDWSERLMGVITLYVGERRPGLHVASTRLAMPVVDAGIKCLIVYDELRHVCPDAFDFVVRFALDNDLAVETRGPSREEAGFAGMAAAGKAAGTGTRRQPASAQVTCGAV